MSSYLLAIDQGTTNSRAVLFNREGTALAICERNLAQFYPADGWVEQDPEAMFTNVLHCCREVLQKSSLTAHQIAGIGITNQRETTIIWDRLTGKPIYPAIVWQDRRTTDICAALSQQPIAEHLRTKTGLLLDPYFSATKIMWLLTHVPEALTRAERGELLFGTVDTYLLWRLTGGRVHATDATNASRTMLFNIHTQQWDEEILTACKIPKAILPEVRDSSAEFGPTSAEFFGSPIPIRGIAGDQQAATIGQACFNFGMAKITYGTGGFLMLNTGEQAIIPTQALLSTIIYRLAGQVTYGVEGSFFAAGTTIKWLRDQLKLFNKAAETEQLAASVESNEGVYLVPAFTGLGAPYWQPHARGAILGLTLKSNSAHIVRAGLESVAYQTRDLMEALTQDLSTPITVLRVDGGMSVNQWLLQFVADILNLPVERHHFIETTALGAMYLAGLQAGIYSSLNEIAELSQPKINLRPGMMSQTRERLYTSWQNAVKQCSADRYA